MKQEQVLLQQTRKPLALISVSNKTGLVPFAQGLERLGWRIISSGGTATALAEGGVTVTTTAEFSGRCMARKLMNSPRFSNMLAEATGATLMHESTLTFLEEFFTERLAVGAMFSHRLATISSPLYAGLFCDLENPAHMEELATVGWEPIHMVVCDFYPLKEAVSAPDATEESVVAQMDVGGPFMVYAAVKGNRIVICNPADRETVLVHLNETGQVSPELQKKLRARAARVVADYLDLPAGFLQKIAGPAFHF